MMVASSMGATAFQKGLGAMHSLSHPCGALLDSHHGLTIGIVMPYVLAFNRPAIDERMTALARYLDLPSPSFQAVLDWVLALRQEMASPIAWMRSASPGTWRRALRKWPPKTPRAAETPER